MLTIFEKFTYDFISLSFLSFVGIYGVYLALTQLLLYAYKQKHSKTPIHYRMFRLYNRNLITNAPSKKEKKFYLVANKVTVTFNCMLVASVLLFIVACFSK